MIDESETQMYPPLRLADGTSFSFARGRQSSLLVDILELLAPRHAPNGILLYVQDTSNKLSIYEREVLTRLGVPLAFEYSLADILLYQQEKHRLYLIYAVDSFGPVIRRRKDDIEWILRQCNVERIYVSVMFNLVDYGLYASLLAWGTSVWLAQLPDHVILHV